MDMYIQHLRKVQICLRQLWHHLHARPPLLQPHLYISTDDNNIIDNQPPAQHPPDIEPPSNNGNNDADQDNQDNQDMEGPKDPQKILGM